MTTLNQDSFYIRTAPSKEGAMEGFFKYSGFGVVALIDDELNIDVRKVNADNRPAKTKLLAGKVEKFTSEDPKAPQYRAEVKNAKGDRAFSISLWRHKDTKRGDTYYSARMQEIKIRLGSDYLA